jgi:general secretion pathway protein I
VTRAPLHLPRPRRPRGFTLLEVMVALGLLAAALMAVADLTGNALRNHVYARDLSAATLLARSKMAELEQKYEDEGFKDFDQQEEGDFSAEARPDVRWRLELVRPSADLSADQLVSMLSGAGLDPQDLMSKLTGGAGGALAGAAAGASGSAASAGGGSGPTTSGGGAMAMVTRMIQGQLTAFGELLKKSFREMRLTVSWPDGKLQRSFTVTTHLLVLNPRAPGGARGENPEVPPNLAAQAATSAAAAAALQGATGATGQQQSGDDEGPSGVRRRRGSRIGVGQ